MGTGIFRASKWHLHFAGTYLVNQKKSAFKGGKNLVLKASNQKQLECMFLKATLKSNEMKGRKSNNKLLVKSYRQGDGSISEWGGCQNRGRFSRSRKDLKSN